MPGTGLWIQAGQWIRVYALNLNIPVPIRSREIQYYIKDLSPTRRLASTSGYSPIPFCLFLRWELFSSFFFCHAETLPMSLERDFWPLANLHMELIVLLVAMLGNPMGWFLKCNQWLRTTLVIWPPQKSDRNVWFYDFVPPVFSIAGKKGVQNLCL